MRILNRYFAGLGLFFLAFSSPLQAEEGMYFPELGFSIDNSYECMKFVEKLLEENHFTPFQLGEICELFLVSNNMEKEDILHIGELLVEKGAAFSVGSGLEYIDGAFFEKNDVDLFKILESVKGYKEIAKRMYMRAYAIMEFFEKYPHLRSQDCMQDILHGTEKYITYFKTREHLVPTCKEMAALVESWFENPLSAPLETSPYVLISDTIVPDDPLIRAKKFLSFLRSPLLEFLIENHENVFFEIISPFFTTASPSWVKAEDILTLMFQELDNLDNEDDKEEDEEYAYMYGYLQLKLVKNYLEENIEKFSQDKRETIERIFACAKATGIDKEIEEKILSKLI